MRPATGGRELRLSSCGIRDAAICGLYGASDAPIYRRGGSARSGPSPLATVIEDSGRPPCPVVAKSDEPGV